MSEGAEEAPEQPTLGERVWEQVSTLGLAVLIALAIRAFVIEPFRIPSGSMLPTLLIGDHLFVNKFIYGAQLPFTSVRLPGLLAHQSTIFGGPGQTLTIRHDSISRESFMPGVLLAVKEVISRRGLIFGLDQLLGLA